MASEITVAPGLLIAMPQLEDPNFHRSVVLMIEHQSEGSFGLIVNRPTEHRIIDLLESIDICWRGSVDETAWWGGPVQQETGWILHGDCDALPSKLSRQIASGLHISSAPEALRLIAEEPPKRLRFILGYSGWGPEQLESEMAQGAWVNSDVSTDLIFDTPAELMWERALERLGITPDSLVPASGVH
ncbi:MAG: YqgE/AlgH family protein [Deltaproteobacteria bacterium]|nr:MAG: YqgE/AlgH family protein [Deltaproteobacteria bacterium]